MRENKAAIFGSGALIGTVGGLIGLGGAEFPLPFLIGGFGFAALEAVILNKAMSLIVVASALPFRARSVPLADVANYWLSCVPATATRVVRLYQDEIDIFGAKRNGGAGECGEELHGVA